MSIWQIQEAIEQTGIEEWGGGFFSIDRTGNVICRPKGERSSSISLPEVISEATKQGITTPMIIRFPQIIKEQLKKMYRSFDEARREFSYQGQYFGVFPFKVNQRREFIDAIVSCGRELDWGLEVGSKTEFMAALSYQLSDKALFICNGFKDKEFVEMAFMATAMGRRVIMVIEGADELHLLIKKLKAHRLAKKKLPSIGLRIKLYSKGSGKWEKSSGETSKFGLTTTELMQALTIIKEEGLEDKMTMLHFHIGSQITAIKRFKNALKEAARVYAKIIKMGFTPQYLNIGGGVGVDYDGSQTAAQSSANYSLQEFANDAVYVIGEVCRNEGVAHPHIVTESGRVIAAYHSVVVTDIREVQGEEKPVIPKESILKSCSKDAHKYISELEYILAHMTSKNFSEYYHDAIEYHEDLFTLFNLGYLNLAERAVAEELFNQICLKALNFSADQKHQAEEFQTLQKIKVAKYLANFSIFQSIPDAWSIDQLFPVLPLSRHHEKPNKKATIVDITCDSDGCLDQFIDRQKEKTVLDLHAPNGIPYYLGFFLVGAYQESLANEHNLFGAIHEVEVNLKPDSSWEVTKTTSGDTIRELLDCRNYDLDEMVQSYEEQIIQSQEKNLIEAEEIHWLRSKLRRYLDLYPYLVEREK